MFGSATKTAISVEDIQFRAIRAAGPGGQHVNKVSSAIHLRFDIRRSSLPESVKQRLLTLPDRRISRDGVINIKAQQHRTQEQNRMEALARLEQLIAQASIRKTPRIPTRPGRAAHQRRMDSKLRRGKLKQLRRRIHDQDF